MMSALCSTGATGAAHTFWNGFTLVTKTGAYQVQLWSLMGHLTSGTAKVIPTGEELVYMAI